MFPRLLLFLVCALGAAAQIQGPAQVDQRARWNRIFTDPKAGFNREPNAFLQRSLEARKPGRALDVGSGMGRNALWLASKGWDVTGIDFSDEGVRLTKEAAAARNLKLNVVRISADEFDYGSAQYDLIIGMYMHQIFSRNAAKMIKALRPGGMVLVEAYHEDISQNAGRPLGYQSNELLRAFDGLRIKYYEDTVGPTDFGSTREPGAIVRLIAVKP